MLFPLEQHGSNTPPPDAAAIAFDLEIELRLNTDLHEALKLKPMACIPKDFIPPPQNSYGPFHWHPTEPMTWAQYRQNSNIFAFAYRGECLPEPGVLQRDPVLLRRLESAWFAWELVQRIAWPAQSSRWIRSMTRCTMGNRPCVVYSNCSVVPEIPLPVQPDMCADGRYGLHEFGWLPQWHDPLRWHMAFIPRSCASGSVGADDDSPSWYFEVHSDPNGDIAWYRLCWEHCVRTGPDLWCLGCDLQQAVRRAAGGAYRAFIQTWTIRQKHHTGHWRAFMPQRATCNIERLVQYLCTEPATAVELVDALAEFQRSILEIRGWILYCLALGPDVLSLDDIGQVQPNTFCSWSMDARLGSKRGAFTSDISVASCYAQLQVPVWLVLDCDEAHYVPSLDESTLASGLLVPHAADSMHVSCVGWSYVEQCLRLNAPCQMRTFAELPQSESILGSESPLRTDSGDHYTVLGKTTQLPVYSNPNVDVVLLSDMTATKPPPWFPTVWSAAYMCAKAVNTSRDRQASLQRAETRWRIPACIFDSGKDFRFPPFTIFVSLAQRTSNRSAGDKSDPAPNRSFREQIWTWLKLRPYRLHQLMSASLASTMSFRAKTWREILKLLIDDRDAYHVLQGLGMVAPSTPLALNRRVFATLLDTVASSVTFDDFPLPTTGPAGLSNHWLCFVIWELSELDFRSELLALDILIHECHSELRVQHGQSPESRYLLTTRCWGGGGLRPEARSNLLCTPDARRLDGLIAFMELMSVWPRASEFLAPWSAYSTPSSWDSPPDFGSPQFAELEDSVWCCYSQTYFDYRHRHAPIPFICPDTAPMATQ